LNDPAATILAFDCSGGACSAAVTRGVDVLAERFVAMTRGHAEALLPQIEAVMAEARLGFSAIDAIATTIGPGSFTGLRIGLAAARGLALAARLPIIALTAFEAYQAQAQLTDNRALAVAIDSRRGSIFLQVFDAAGEPLAAPASVEPGALAAALPLGDLLVVGDGTEAFQAIGRPDMALRPLLIKARYVAAAAALAGPAIRARPPSPLYLRPPDVTLPDGAP
jgi:tRNA threonylcarbamoyladenosine biosynthesis protein TsaB